MLYIFRKVSKADLLARYIKGVHIDRACCRCGVEKGNIIKKHVNSESQLYGVSELVLASTTEILVSNKRLEEAIKNKQTNKEEG